eukprot:CAMPEP_0172484798 /NCGR_PEP_ID=MMETSP1066-20121228/12408_1 /TAXON_ID=671091 /ORGANISM="Coscinodiscus wailesii, Strain CCMP2513" /LENGTH=59 /DNA_ID=CAMNT_0013249551 /DNA_START=37 /DNA_END=213 /DNA_ORIENTATION=+
MHHPRCHFGNVFEVIHHAVQNVLSVVLYHCEEPMSDRLAAEDGAAEDEQVHYVVSDVTV